MIPFNKFYFDHFAFDYETLIASFSYSFDESVYFTETIDFKAEWFQPRDNIDKGTFKNILFHLHIAMWISYYKAYPTKELIVKSWYLNDDQKSFWGKFYQNWMGEFLYKNKIIPQGLFNFINYETQKEIIPTKYKINTDKAILPFGWWKDSLVSFELLRTMWVPLDLFTFGKDYEAHKSSANLTWEKRMVIQRHIDPKLFEMNQNGYFNGHVPITWIISFSLTVISYLYDYKYIVFSNEKSADVENIIWEWMKINHQFSKSVEFEKDFNHYVKKNISEDVRYFSLLNWLYDLNVAKIFSHYPQYFTSFVSCNNNFKIIEKNKYTDQRRCLACPKCFSVFCMLRPRITDQQVIEIFGRDIYQEEDKVSEFKKLLGVEDHKPFECVWTTRESTLAMYYVYQQYKQADKELWPVLSFFEQEILPTLDEKKVKELEIESFNLYLESTIPQEIAIKLNVIMK